MSCHSQQVHAELLHVHRDLAARLSGVRVKGYSMMASDFADIFDRLDGPGLIVGLHYGNEDGLWRDGTSYLSCGHKAVTVNRKVSDAES